MEGERLQRPSVGGTVYQASCGLYIVVTLFELTFPRFARTNYPLVCVRLCDALQSADRRCSALPRLSYNIELQLNTTQQTAFRSVQLLLGLFPESTRNVVYLDRAGAA